MRYCLYFLLLLKFAQCQGNVALNRQAARSLKSQEIIRNNVKGKDNHNAQKPQHTGKLANITLAERLHAMGPGGLTTVKRNTEKRIRSLQEKLNKTAGLDRREMDFKFHLLELFIEELAESEKDMIDAQLALKNSLLTDFRDPSVLMANSKQRLEALRIATLKEEQSYNKIKSIEEALTTYKLNNNHTKSLMDGFLEEIADAADQLESDIQPRIMLENNNLEGLDPANIEAVVHLKEGDEGLQSNFSFNSKGDYDDRLDILVDAQNNKFILSRPKDTTSPSIDHYLILDLIFIYLLSFVLVYLCSFFGVLSIFGYIMSGLILGPSGLNKIQSLVQVESFGELGVYMIMFFAGMEFSIDKIQKVWKVAVKAAILIPFIMVVCGVLVGVILNDNVPFGESSFIAVCMSISSTPLVVRFLQDSENQDVKEYTSVLLAMLVMQDVQVGLTVAILPTFVPSARSSYGNALVTCAMMILRSIASITAVALAAALLSRACVGRYFSFLTKKGLEFQLSGVLLFMFSFQLFTNSFGISMELGCFIAGFLISVFNYSAAVEKLMKPIHDLFVILFFATVGFHVFPKFVMEEFYYLVILTAVVIGGKYLISLFVLHLVLGPKQKQMKWLISGGLAQVSEFAFVLGSRARHLKIVSREVFLLILSITTLSLAFAPVMWKLSIWKFKRRDM